ncbi:hypothetical protein EST38_g5887 [Candolleomyces aberdarensis]|uniref:Uncharacterized protein n=1 Tax=Candolleomyces aberdarensis TaxID=2316362 RepID=A0A4Q2DJB9_9AGAR|nr:hypothetical protein EST38_g5887 [Candolleomyces aberdarensis]
MTPSEDYIQLLHNHVGGDWEDLKSESPGMHTLRYLIRGEEVGRASATRKVLAKKIVAYRYLRDNDLIKKKDQEMEAQL